MTSGNLAGEPIVIDDDEALDRLADLADAWLTHDRPIHVPCDDSVTRVVDGRESPIRRSRGQAPLPLDLPFESPAALGVGADLKNTFCLAEGRLAWMSAHVGDMDDLSTLARLRRRGAAPGDADRGQPGGPRRRPAPGATGRADGRSTTPTGRPVVERAAPPRARRRHDGRQPGARWRPGARASPSTAPGTARTAPSGAASSWSPTTARSTVPAHLAYVALPGGDAGVRNPNRMALSHLRSAGVDWDPALPCVRASEPDELALLDRQLDTGFGCAPTSSMGRLFDAVASLAGICHRAGYDAQAAMELEALRAARRPVRGLPLRPRRRPTAGGSRLRSIRAGRRRRPRGAAPALVAARFQQGVVDMVVAVLPSAARPDRPRRAPRSAAASSSTASSPPRCARALAGDGFDVLQHHRVPASDAGIALGQVAVLAHAPSHTDRRP